MESDATYKHVLSFAFMVEELLRWLVADLHGMHALVDALDFSTLTRVHEQSVTAGAGRCTVTATTWCGGCICASEARRIQSHRAGRQTEPLHPRAATARSPNRPGRGCTWW